MSAVLWYDIFDNDIGYKQVICKTKTMKPTEIFHYIVRGVIVKDNKILLAQKLEKETSFLPGGHIEDYESAEEALIREIDEELKSKCTIDYFLGAIENKWIDVKTNNFELNLIFKVTIKDIQTDISPKSHDSRIRFFWIDIKRIDSISLKPDRLYNMIKRNLNKKDNHFWTSNY